MDIILATRNPGKVQQIRFLFRDEKIGLISLDEAGISGEGEENGATLSENARKKARYAVERGGMPAIADDTGIFIDALNGAPGVYSARWAGEGKGAQEIMEHTLRQMNGVPPNRRTAIKKTAACLVMPDGRCAEFVGIQTGTLLLKPRGDPRLQMPYAPIFLPTGSDRTLSEMSIEEEIITNSRGRAFVQLASHIKVRFLS